MLFKGLTAVRAAQALVQPVAAIAHPADLFCRVAHHEGVARSAAGQHGSGADEGVGADGVPAHYCGVGADGGPGLHQRGPHLVHAGDVRPWIEHVGEHHGGPAKHVVFQGHALVHRDVVLDLAAVPDDRARADHHVLADAAVAADLRALEHVAEVPYLRVLTDANVLIDKARLVGKEALRLCEHER